MKYYRHKDTTTRVQYIPETSVSYIEHDTIYNFNSWTVVTIDGHAFCFDNKPELVGLGE